MIGTIPLFRLSNELIIRTLSFLNDSDAILEFLFSSPSLYYQFYGDYNFWRDLCFHLSVTYRHPSISWRDYVLSKEIYYTCPHLKMSLFQSLSQKQELAFFPANNTPLDNTRYRCICLYPYCDFIETKHSHFGEERDHFHACSHPISLQISLFHVFTIHCRTCDRPLGEDGKLASEKWFTLAIAQTLATPRRETSFNIIKELYQCRRHIESSIFNRPGWSYIIEKSWYDKWVLFLKGQLLRPPGKLNNKVLLDHENGLISTLKIGIDFELVNNASRYSIERLYGLTGTILSEYDLQADPCYYQMLHDIHLFQQQARFWPPNI